MRFDQRAAVAPAPARQPGQRAFCFIDNNPGASEVSNDLPLRQGEMLCAEIIDDRLQRLRRRAYGFSALAAKLRLPAAGVRRWGSCGGHWRMSCVGLFAYIGAKNGRPAGMAEKDIHNF